MASKRKRAPAKKPANKRGKKKEIDSEMDSELSDASDLDQSNHQPDEVLIAGHGDVMDTPSKLPEELLKSMIKPTGPIIIFGMVNWDFVGKKDPKKGGQQSSSLFSPHRYRDVKARLAVSGPVSAHSVLVNDDGQAMTFGRNSHGQLGLGDTTTRDNPVVIPGLSEQNIIGASCGRNHTLFLTDTGTVYACGDNKCGQCGVGNTAPTVNTPTRINYRGPPIIKVGCGGDFSVILDCKGGLHSFGLPEYGQLGHNTDGKYFQTSTKLNFHYETSPKRIVLYLEKTKDGHVSPVDVTEIVDFCCGPNHTVAIDSQKRAFSWGFGGFGRLGHAEQRDELVPRLIKYFDTQSRGVRSVHCGSTFSMAVTDIGITKTFSQCGLFMFGQTKRTGEANMYPKPVQDLAGWDIKHIATGFTSVVVAADESVIAWGASPTYGELGFGEFQKTSASPKEVTKLDGIKVSGVGMGYSHTMIIAAVETPEQQEKVDALPLFEP